MRITKALSVLLLPAAFGLAAFPVAAVDVTVSVSPASSRGPCPVEFNFTGQVTLTKGKVGLFTYKWERSDGGVDTIVHPTVSYDGVHAALVTTTWTLGAAMPAFHPFHGWMKLHILTPQNEVSAPANFTLDCGGGTNTGGPKHPNCDGKPDLVPLLHTPMDGWVAVKNIGTGNAGPSRLIIKCVKEGHTGPGGGCVDLPDSAITPPFFPTPDALGLNVPALPCGKEFPAPMAFWGSMKWPKGTYHFTATADATNAVVESNEGNNVTTSSMTR
jgi:CARDB